MDRFFFSDKLLQKRKDIQNAALTTVEAPAGYGKTTAVHMALDPIEKSTVHWYTAVENMQDSSFNWLIHQIGKVDEPCGARIQELGFLNRSNAAAAAELLMSAKVEEPLYLVVDNFQYVVDHWQPQILAALTNRPGDGLHVILISQNFGRLRTVLMELDGSICQLRSKDLLLRKQDIAVFAEQMGVTITPQQLQIILGKTDGWAVAVSLYLQNLCQRETNAFDAQDTDELLYEIFWKRLSEEDQEILLRLCLFDRLRGPMLKQILPERLYHVENLTSMLGRVPLIRCNEEKREYFPHEILMKFLQNRLKNETPEFQREVYQTTGRFQQENGWIKEAVNCYFKAADYEPILACELVGLLTETFDGIPYTEVARTVLKRSSDDLWKKYPISVLRLCYALYAGTAFEEFETAMGRLHELIWEKGNEQIMGEWLLVSALSDFPDIDRMGEKYKRAEELMTAPSAVFTCREPFMFGSTSMWYLFYTTPGKMLETADRLEQAMTVYNRVTNGHGAGAAELYRGEAYSVQARFRESDIQAYQAAFLAEQTQNASVTYGVALLLGINAIYQSNMIALQKAIEYLENKTQAYPFLQGKSINTYMVETVRGYLLGLLMETGRSALWTQGEADHLADLTFTNFMIKTCRITDLILKKQYSRAIASVETSLKLDNRLISLPTRNFMYTGLALCYMAIGRLGKAAEYLDQALTIAGQDQNYTFLACFRKYLRVLFLLPQIASKHETTIWEIKRLEIHYTRVEESQIFSMLEKEPNCTQELSDREREIAELAAKGMRNSEIAEKLFISENTVKTHLKTIFQKLNIDRRGLLIEMLK